MTKLDGRTTTALLVVDVQNDVMVGAHERDVVVGRIAELVKAARAAGVPVVWVQDSLDGSTGTDGWQIVPELPVADGVPVVHKDHGDAFEATELEALLAERGVGRLVVTGAQTDACIRATLHGGFVRGYDVTLVSDAHTTEDLTSYGAPPPGQVIDHTNLYWGFQSGPGRTADVTPAAEVVWSPGQ